MSDSVYLVTRQVSDIEAWQAIHPGGSLVCLCTRESVVRECRDKGFESVLMTEELLRAAYPHINRWAYEETGRFIGHFKNARDLALFLYSYHQSIKALFIHVLSVHLVVAQLAAKYGIQKMGIVEPRPSWFGEVIKVCLETYHPDIVLVSVARGEAQAGSSKPAHPKEILRNYLAALHRPYGRKKFSKTARAKKHILVSGATRHLAPAIRRIMEGGAAKIFFCENSFDFSKFIYCLRNRFVYLVSGVPREHPLYDGKISGYFKKEGVVYDGKDLSLILGRLIETGMRGPQFHAHFDHELAPSLFAELEIDAVLLDEDNSPRRIWAGLAVSHDRPAFVVSHGIPAIAMPESGLSAPGATGSESMTFVHSDFEKQAYRKIVFDEDRLVVTGLPRYDRLYRERARPARPARNLSAAQSILFCSSLMAEWDFETPYADCGMKDVWGDHMKACLKDLLEVAGGLKEAVVKIKPHYNDEKVYRAQLKNLGRAGSFAKLLSHRKNIYNLVADSDVVVTPESTVICEAIMMGKPVIVLDYARSRLTLPQYEEKGVVMRAVDKETLSQALHKVLYDPETKAALERRREEAGDYFKGPSDGKNSDRVAKIVWESMRGAK